jgi:intein/homing endonuclease
MMLDSVTYETEILVRNKKGFVTKYMIGEFVENHIVKSERVERYDDKDMTWAALDEEKEYYEIMSATEDGRTEWCRIEGVSKHPVINKDGSNIMLKVTTEYCKEVTATKAKSFLQLVDGKIQEVDGDKLKVGDYIPVSFKKIDYTKVFELDLKEICPPNEYLYTSELAKAKEVMHEHKWWMKHSGKTFILPHSRSDAVVQLLRETPRKGLYEKYKQL